MDQQFIKFDDGKPKFTMIPQLALNELDARS
jgi:hypothetical protein